MSDSSIETHRLASWAFYCKLPFSFSPAVLVEAAQAYQRNGGATAWLIDGMGVGHVEDAMTLLSTVPEWVRYFALPEHGKLDRVGIAMPAAHQLGIQLALARIPGSVASRVFGSSDELLNWFRSGCP